MWVGLLPHFNFLKPSEIKFDKICKREDCSHAFPFLPHPYNMPARSARLISWLSVLPFLPSSYLAVALRCNETKPQGWGLASGATMSPTLGLASNCSSSSSRIGLGIWCNYVSNTWFSKQLFIIKLKDGAWHPVQLCLQHLV